jgi:two-component system, chemotaxis family, CheB/CheR fusion protein
MNPADGAAPREARPGTAVSIVAVGASSGGLEACRKLFAALPADPGLAFVLVLHLDPNHTSMVADLLGADTRLDVREAVDGQRVTPGHVHVIPPGRYLAVRHGTLRLSNPGARHGARMPFDFLLASLAADAGERAMCVVLSGAGNDGSVGLRAISSAGGLVIAQDPAEAEWSGMPESAVATGLVDHVLPLARIPDLIMAQAAKRAGSAEGSGDSGTGDDAALEAILSMVRARAAQDLTLYKRGTLERRIARRMALVGLGPVSMTRYLESCWPTPSATGLPPTC